MSKSQTSPSCWHFSNWKCYKWHHLSIIQEHVTLIIFLKKISFQVIRFSWNCCWRPKCIISLFAESSHILHAADNMICSETTEDIYNLKIECISESETQWGIGTWFQTSVPRLDSVKQLQKKKYLSLRLFLFFWGDKYSWALWWSWSTLTH